MSEQFLGRWLDTDAFFRPLWLLIKVTGYNCNFARAIINLYTKHWAVNAENFGVSFRGVETLCDPYYGLF